MLEVFLYALAQRASVRRCHRSPPGHGIATSVSDLSVIAMWLGHESIETTHQYLDADLETKRRALDRLQSPKVRRPGPKARTQLVEFLRRL